MKRATDTSSPPPATSGAGYLNATADGGVFSFGTAAFHGSDTGKATSPVVGAA